MRYIYFVCTLKLSHLVETFFVDGLHGFGAEALGVGEDMAAWRRARAVHRKRTAASASYRPHDDGAHSSDERRQRRRGRVPRRPAFRTREHECRTADRGGADCALRQRVSPPQRTATLRRGGALSATRPFGRARSSASFASLTTPPSSQRGGGLAQ